jgi:hypothetical protein
MVLLEMLSGQYPLDSPDVRLPFRESPEAIRYNARVRAERPTWTSVGELADRILSFGPEDVERVARKVPEPLTIAACAPSSTPPSQPGPGSPPPAPAPPPLTGEYPGVEPTQEPATPATPGDHS